MREIPRSGNRRRRACSEGHERKAEPGAPTKMVLEKRIFEIDEFEEELELRIDSSLHFDLYLLLQNKIPSYADVVLEEVKKEILGRK